MLGRHEASSPRSLAAWALLRHEAGLLPRRGASQRGRFFATKQACYRAGEPRSVGASSPRSRLATAQGSLAAWALLRHEAGLLPRRGASQRGRFFATKQACYRAGEPRSVGASSPRSSFAATHPGTVAIWQHSVCAGVRGCRSASTRQRVALKTHGYLFSRRCFRAVSAEGLALAHRREKARGLASFSDERRSRSLLVAATLTGFDMSIEGGELGFGRHAHPHIGRRSTCTEGRTDFVIIWHVSATIAASPK
jgi:hypothetical protein